MLRSCEAIRVVASAKAGAYLPMPSFLLPIMQWTFVKFGSNSDLKLKSGMKEVNNGPQKD
jgi:hypothetical protein